MWDGDIIVALTNNLEADLIQLREVKTSFGLVFSVFFR